MEANIQMPERVGTLPLSSSSRAVPPAGRERFRSLDGLRGLAAMAVLGFHLTILSPAIAWHSVERAEAPTAWSAEWWVAVTPLRLLTAGEEAVFVFFVLSGFVLTVPVLRAASLDWFSFMTARVWRLFIPTAASLLLAYVLIKLSPRVADPAGSSWLQPPSNPVAAGWVDVLRGMDLVLSDPVLNGPTWTLRWEMLFSLLLPFAIGIALVAARVPAVFSVIVLTAAMAAGMVLGLHAVFYLPMFLLGVLLAVHLPALGSGAEAMAARWPRGVRVVLTMAVVLALAMLSTYFLVRPHVDPSGMVAVAARIVSVLGAALLVAVVAVGWPNSGWLTGRVAQWLGKISFSLYLVHQPILATIGFAFGPDRWALASVVGAAASLLAAFVFWRLIESPSHEWSRAFGRSVSRLVRERATAGEASATSPASSHQH